MSSSTQDDQPDAYQGSINCPDCGTAIPFSISVLLAGDELECRCGVKLSLDQEKSAASLDSLKQAQAEITDPGSTETEDTPPE